KASRIPWRRRERVKANTPPACPPAAWRARQRAPRLITAARSSLLRHQNDLDASILGAAFRRRVVGHRLELAEGGGRKLGRLDALLMEITRDVDRARGRQLPVGRIALGERGRDGLVVRVPLDTHRLVAVRYWVLG